jgi:hypothetical protein
MLLGLRWGLLRSRLLHVRERFERLRLGLLIGNAVALAVLGGDLRMNLVLGHALRTERRLRGGLLRSNLRLARKAGCLPRGRDGFHGRSGRLRNWCLSGCGRRKRSGKRLRGGGRLRWLRYGGGWLFDFIVIIQVSRESHATELKARANDIGMVSRHDNTFLLIEDWPSESTTWCALGNWGDLCGNLGSSNLHLRYGRCDGAFRKSG